jgi:hypothetical protein
MECIFLFSGWTLIASIEEQIVQYVNLFWQYVPCASFLVIIESIFVQKLVNKVLNIIRQYGAATAKLKFATSPSSFPISYCQCHLKKKNESTEKGTLLNFIKGEVRFEPGLASTASHALASKTPGRSIQCHLQSLCLCNSANKRNESKKKRNESEILPSSQVCCHPWR